MGAQTSNFFLHSVVVWNVQVCWLSLEPAGCLSAAEKRAAARRAGVGD